MGPKEESAGDRVDLVRARRSFVPGQGPVCWSEGVSVGFPWHRELEFGWRVGKLRSTGISVDGFGCEYHSGGGRSNYGCTTSELTVWGPS